MKQLHEKKISELYWDDAKYKCYKCGAEAGVTLAENFIEFPILKKWAIAVVKDMDKRDDAGKDIDGYVEIRCFLKDRFEITEDNLKNYNIMGVDFANGKDKTVMNGKITEEELR